jgi:hypothetical protein
MAEIKSLSDIREKWQRVTPQRSEDYKRGVTNPRRDWEEQTAAAKDNWKSGVDAAAAKDLFGKGVSKAGTAKWKTNALKKGPARFSEGVYLAAPDFEKGFAPFHAAIERADFGPRFPRRDPRNIERVRLANEAMVSAKMA